MTPCIHAAAAHRDCRLLQVLAPWRQVMAQLLAHDRAVALRIAASAWGARCRDNIPDYEVHLQLHTSSPGTGLKYTMCNMLWS